MYFLNAKKAIRDLQTGAIDERASLKYLIGLSILAGLGVPTFIKQAPENTLWILELVTFSIGVTLFVIALRKTYRLNATTGSTFLPRFLTLNFIVSLQTILITCVPYIILMVICYATALLRVQANDSPMPAMLLALAFEILLDFLFEVGGVILWFCLIIRAFQKLKSTQDSQQPGGAVTLASAINE